ncbi:MAG: hypothetical protein BWY11_01060 [Firmicutes bacterium ADurb.Bin182]|nr:MAG: hypothetical protein BWY11_01060 [Firmicutes bacterium ADurb.Bin182]
MKKLFAVLLTLAMIFMFPACATRTKQPEEPVREPVSADSIAIYESGGEISAAVAAMNGLPITVWGIKGSELTDGPFKGWEVYTEENSLTGLNIYSIFPGSESSVKEFYDNELSDYEWTEGDDVSGDSFSGFSWRRGSQAFVAVIVKTNNGCVLITYLLNE